MSAYMHVYIRIGKHEMREKILGTFEIIRYTSFTPCFLIKNASIYLSQQGNFCFTSILATITHYTIKWLRFVKGSEHPLKCHVYNGINQNEDPENRPFVSRILFHRFAVIKNIIKVISCNTLRTIFCFSSKISINNF